MTLTLDPVEFKKPTVAPAVITGVSNAPENAPKNLFIFMADDIGRSQMPCYKDLSQWPANMPFPSMPFIDGIAQTEALRFTNARVNARCSPTRASMMSGRLPHIWSGHPHGTGIGDVPGQTPSTQVPFWRGLQPEHRPWPKVLKEAGAPHKTVTGPKYHLFERVDEGENNVINRRAQVEIAGFDRSIQAILSGDGEPWYGYKDYNTWISDVDSLLDSNETNVQTFNPTWFYERLIEWIDENLGAAQPKPIVVNWWMNLPHGNPPAFPQNSGPNGEQVHTTYTEAELIPNTTSTDGKVALGDPRAGYDAAGGEMPDGADPNDYLYTEYGAVHVFWRRTVALYEAMDYFTKKLHDYIKDNYLAAYRNSLWVHYSDNGGDHAVLTPVATSEFAHLGPQYAATFPPTYGANQGTISGERYHDPDDAKGSIKDEGILTHLLVWGPQLPEERRGTDCDALVSAVDFYPTFLDFLAPDTWRDALGADLDKLDGESFLARIMDGQTGDKRYTYHAVQKPGWVQDETWHVHQFDRCIVMHDGTDVWKWRGVFEQEYDNGGSGGAIIQPKDYLLYRLTDDPTEQNDLRSLYGDPEYPEITAVVDELSPLYLAMFSTS